MSDPRSKAAETRERKKREAAKRRREEEQRRIAEEQERKEALRIGMQRKQAYNMLQSELTGLYDEMDKLTKKAANEPITPLQLKIVNNLIRKAKHLLTGDTIIGEVEVFVAAGDNPEYRDVVTVLRQIRQGMERYKSSHSFIFSGSFTSELMTLGLDHEVPGDFFADLNEPNDGATE